MQGWEIAHLISSESLVFCQKISDLLTSLICLDLSDLSESLTVAHLI